MTKGTKMVLECVCHIENIIEVEKSTRNIEENEETDNADENESQIYFSFDFLPRNSMSESEKKDKLRQHFS